MERERGGERGGLGLPQTERETEIISCEIMRRERKKETKTGRKRKKERKRDGELAAQLEDINLLNAVIRANPKYRASIKHGTKIIICTG